MPRRPRPGRGLGPLVGLALLLPACAPAPLPERVAGPPAPRFDVARDAFAFPNLVRAQRPGLNDGFANHCIVMARAAGQFFRFARFAPGAPPLPAGEYTRLAREVLAIAPWTAPRPDAERVPIPGYASLRELSLTQAPALKAAFGSSLLSMAHWRTWRVALALSPEHQAALARELEREVDAGRPATVMVTNFPHEDLLNHAVLVYDYGVRAGSVEFLAYDPNDPDSPLALHFDPATRGFWVGPLPYSPPGRVRAFRLFAAPLL